MGVRNGLGPTRGKGGGGLRPRNDGSPLSPPLCWENQWSHSIRQSIAKHRDTAQRGLAGDSSPVDHIFKDGRCPGGIHFCGCERWVAPFDCRPRNAIFWTTGDAHPKPGVFLGSDTLGSQLIPMFSPAG